MQCLHFLHLHAGPTLLLGIVSLKYYVVGARQLIRNVSRGCVTCRKTYARTATQLMGDLPSIRVKPSPPFSTTGVDFAGPITLRRGHTRKPTYDKAYMCVFVCLTTKIFHLELMSDLSTEAFLAALRHFIARRGCPYKILSDNGTNFVGANHELQELYHHLETKESQGKICNFTAARKIVWTFSPGRAPHFGGLWEAAVKSAKSLLRKLLGTLSLTVEEYATILTDVEATLNSRPLCPMNTQPEDGLDVLTHGHFLIGRSLSALPQHPMENLPMSSKKRWHICQKVSTEFWQRWSKEYLQTLQRRQKWKNPQRDFNVDDVVLIKDQELFVRSWPLAIITKLHTGPDGRVRAVTLRTQKGVYTRPIIKLVLLIPQEKDEVQKNLSSQRMGEDVQAQP